MKIKKPHKVTSREKALAIHKAILIRKLQKTIDKKCGNVI